MLISRRPAYKQPDTPQKKTNQKNQTTPKKPNKPKKPTKTMISALVGILQTNAEIIVFFFWFVCFFGVFRFFVVF